MEIPFYQIDAFTSEVFSGNPAGVCLLDLWLEDNVLQSIAEENNLPETAFLVRQQDHYALRWFTPKVEIDLCGHATLASGHVLFEFVDPEAKQIEFVSKSETLCVERKDGLLFMDFPSRRPISCPPPDGIDSILGAVPSEVSLSRDLMVVFENEEVIKEMNPDFAAIAQLDYFAVIVTAPGRKCDFVSRFFAPRADISEDPVTGSAHCTLIPYWAARLGRRTLHALQLSKRGGELYCEDRGDRVTIGGRAVTYLRGTITI
jgi:predicted PhzF superfamily epimerase YddE/YHI9